MLYIHAVVVVEAEARAERLENRKKAHYLAFGAKSHGDQPIQQQKCILRRAAEVVNKTKPRQK